MKKFGSDNLPSEETLEIEGVEPSSAEEPRAVHSRFAEKDLSRRHSEWSEAARIIHKTPPLQPNLSALAWKSFLGVGIVSATYFISLASSDPTNFWEGVGILRRIAVQIFATLVIWGLGFWIYRQASPELQKKIEKTFLLSCVGVVFMVITLVLGMSESSVRRIWLRPKFLFLLGFQAMAIFCLYRLRARMREKIKFGEASFAARHLVYGSEGLMLYFVLGLFLQALFRFDVGAILGMLVQNPRAFLFFSLPFFGYLFLRKLVGEL